MPESVDDKALMELCRGGDQEAARQLFDAYVDRLVALARRRISARLAGRVDPEDVVQSVFRTFFHRVQGGQFRVAEEDDLCKLLMRMTVHKTLRQVAFHKAAKRNMEQEAPADEDARRAVQEMIDREPTPEEAVTFLDQLESFMNRLRPKDREILELRLQGWSNDEIASKLDISSDRMIRRVLERVRGVAEREGI
jgi:RNA polymerase sigma-70 factor (ECF subfamily)